MAAFEGEGVAFGGEGTAFAGGGVKAPVVDAVGTGTGGADDDCRCFTADVSLCRRANTKAKLGQSDTTKTQQHKSTAPPFMVAMVA